MSRTHNNPRNNNGDDTPMQDDPVEIPRPAVVDSIQERLDRLESMFNHAQRQLPEHLQQVNHRLVHEYEARTHLAHNVEQLMARLEQLERQGGETMDRLNRLEPALVEFRSGVEHQINGIGDVLRDLRGDLSLWVKQTEDGMRDLSLAVADATATATSATATANAAAAATPAPTTTNASSGSSSTRQPRPKIPSPPERFSGNQGEDLRQWRIRWELYQEAHVAGGQPLAEDYLVSMAVVCFSGHALTQWTDMPVSQRPRTWESFSQWLDDRFRPANASVLAMRALDACVQGRRSVADYIAAFTACISDARQHDSISDAEARRAFIRGLCDAARNYVEDHHPQVLDTTLAAVQSSARSYDTTYGQERANASGSNPYAASSSSSSRPGGTAASQWAPQGSSSAMEVDEARLGWQEIRRKNLCIRCQRPGHIGVDCPSFPGPAPRRRNQGGNVKGKNRQRHPKDKGQ